MAGNSAILSIKILADATKAGQTMQAAATRAEKFGAGLRRAMLPATAVIAGLGLMGKAAADDARAQAILANTLIRTTGATRAQVAATEDWINKTALATGVADDQLRPALSKLATATGDVATAQSAMGVALDVAAATGKDVETVAAALAKGYAGNTSALKKLVPGIDEAAVKSKDMALIMADLAKKTGGTAAAAADTAAGKMQRAALAMDEVKESAGAALLPVLEKLGAVLGKVAAWAQNNAGAAQTLVLVLGGLAVAVYAANAAIGVYNTVTTIASAVTKAFAKDSKLAAAASKAWAAAQWLLNIAMSANPIGIIILIVVALVAAIVIAYKKSETFRKIVAAAWKGIQTAAKAVWDFLWRNVISPLIAAWKAMYQKAGQMAALVIAAWAGLKAGLKAVWDWIKLHVIDPLRNAFDAVVDAVKGVIDWIKNIKLPAAVQKALDWVTGNSTKAAPTALAPAPTVAARTTPRSAAGDRRSPAAPGGGLVVNVILDGKKVGGYVDRVVLSALEAEGFALAAGAWGS